MTRPPAAAVIPALVLAACAGELPPEAPSGPLQSAPDTGGGRSRDEPRYDGGAAAVEAEFDAADRAGTAEAWRLVAERHPDHPRAAAARRRAAALDGKPA